MSTLKLKVSRRQRIACAFVVVAALILLHLATAAAQRIEPRGTFDVISIRPSVPRQLGGRGGPGGGAGVNQEGCGGPAPSSPEVTPGRIVITRATVYRLVTLAYGIVDCPIAARSGLVSGGPDWTRSDQFDIQATIPEGSSAYTRRQLLDGEAPRLQGMIQSLLIDRFKLSVRREKKEVQAFSLVVANLGKIKYSEDQTAPAAYDASRGFTGNLPRGVMMNCTGKALAIAQVAACLQNLAGGLIIDSTELTGLYDIPPVTSPDPLAPMSEAYRLSQTLEQVGLRLARVKTTIEALSIDRVEKPTEN